MPCCILIILAMLHTQCLAKFHYAGPYLLQCPSGCVGFCKRCQPSCAGPWGLSKKRWGPWMVDGQVNTTALRSKTNSIDGVVRGTVGALYSGNSNINHAFHDEFYSILSWYRHYRNVTLVWWAQSEWLTGLVQAAAQLYGWRLVRAPMLQRERQWICAKREGGAELPTHMDLNGADRALRYRHDEIPQLKEALRQHVLHSIGTLAPRRPLYSQRETLVPRERIVIYTRMDSPWRQLLEPESVAALFDARFDVEVVPSMPRGFAEQVRLFSRIALLVAPNGGWIPNVLWLPSNACVVEAHLYRLDSWLLNFGLAGGALSDGAVLTVVGDYHNRSVPKMRPRPQRVHTGGDDALLGSHLAPDIAAALRNHSRCQRFLNNTAQLIVGCTHSAQRTALPCKA